MKWKTVKYLSDSERIIECNENGEFREKHKGSVRNLIVRYYKDYSPGRITVRGKDYYVTKALWRTFVDDNIGNTRLTHINGDRTDNRLSNLCIKKELTIKRKKNEKKVVKKKSEPKKTECGKLHIYQRKARELGITYGQYVAHSRDGYLDIIKNPSETHGDDYNKRLSERKKAIKDSWKTGILPW